MRTILPYKYTDICIIDSTIISNFWVERDKDEGILHENLRSFLLTDEA